MRLVNDHIYLFEDQDLHWPFRGECSFSVKLPGARTWGTDIYVDPCPGHPHNPELVHRELQDVLASFPIGKPVYYALLPREDMGRTNGYAQKLDIYNEETKKWDDWVGLVVLLGKRIPIMPAMTRYLVAHEYGHHVQYWLEKQLGVDEEELKANYADIRGMERSPRKYGPATWPDSVGEVFANDFRILLAKKELEFWPHNVPRPEEVPSIISWWENVLETCKAKGE